MKSVRVPLPTLGVDLLSDETGLRAGTVRRAENVDLRKDGGFARRSGYAILATDGEYHSIRVLKARRQVIIGRGNFAILADEVLNEIGSIDMGSNTALDVCEENGRVYVSNAGRLVWLREGGNTFADVGLAPVSPLPTMMPHDAGAYLPGGYAVAVSRVDATGEESPALHLGAIRLEQQGAIRLSGLPFDADVRYRLYVTPTDGDVLYLVEEIPGTLTDFVIGRPPDGNMPATLDLQTMPSGRWVRYHAGRLYVARGTNVWFSEPLRPHLCNPAHNVIALSANARMLEAVVGGIFVADDRGVLFYGGNDPTQFSVRRVSDDRVLTGTSIVLPGSALGARESAQSIVLWLSEAGYAYGMADGSVGPVNPGRIKLDQGLSGRSAFIQRNGMKQVVTLVDSSTTQTFGVAVDSIIQ